MRLKYKEMKDFFTDHKLKSTIMEKTKVTSGLTVSLDGFAAGHNQSFEKPFGDRFDSDLLDRWMFAEPEKHRHQKEIDAILDAGEWDSNDLD